MRVGLDKRKYCESCERRAGVCLRVHTSSTETLGLCLPGMMELQPHTVLTTVPGAPFRPAPRSTASYSCARSTCLQTGQTSLSYQTSSRVVSSRCASPSHGYQSSRAMELHCLLLCKTACPSKTSTPSWEKTSASFLAGLPNGSSTLCAIGDELIRRHIRHQVPVDHHPTR